MRGRGRTFCCNRRTTAAWKYVKNPSRRRGQAETFALDEVLQHTAHNVALYIYETRLIFEKVSPGAEMMNLTA